MSSQKLLLQFDGYAGREGVVENEAPDGLLNEGIREYWFNDPALDEVNMPALTLPLPLITPDAGAREVELA